MASVTRSPTLKQTQHAEDPELGKSRLTQYRNLLVRNKEIPNCQPDLFYWGISLLYPESQGADSTVHLQKSGTKPLVGKAAAALGRSAVLRTAQGEDSAAPQGKPACASRRAGCHGETQRRSHSSRRNDESRDRPPARQDRAARAGAGVGAVWPYLG